MDDTSNFGNRAAVVGIGTTTSRRRDPDLRRLDDTKRRRLERHSLYEPQTQETRAVYDALLDVFRHHLAGAQPLDDVLAASAAAHEVLATLKDDGSPAETKKQEIEKLLNPISDEMFAELVSIADRITDFHHNDHEAAPAATSSSSHGASASSISDVVHAAVETTMIPVDDDDHRRDGPPAAARAHKQYEYRPNKMVIFGYDDDADDDQMQLQDDDDDVVVDDNDYGDLYHTDDDDSSQAPPTVDARDIDACWLQKKVCRAYYDASEEIVGSQQGHHDLVAEEILKIMADVGNDDRDVENRLVALFDYDKFDLIKLLLRNRLKIVWCTRLARAQHHEQQRKEIEEEMASDPTLARILVQLRHVARASEEEKDEQKQQDSQDAHKQQ